MGSTRELTLVGKTSREILIRQGCPIMLSIAFIGLACLISLWALHTISSSYISPLLAPHLKTTTKHPKRTIPKAYTEPLSSN